MRAWALMGVLALGLMVRLLVCAQDVRHLAEYPFHDDSFYALNIARNIASGAGPTHDGRHLTNGFQPLYVLLMVPVYWLFPHDRVAPIYIAAVFLSLCSVGACYVLFQLARRAFSERAGYLAIAPLLFTTYAVGNSVNGLETSLYVLLVFGTALYYVTHIRECKPTTGSCVVFGLLAGWTVWARMDGGFFVMAVFVDQVWIWGRARYARKGEAFVPIYTNVFRLGSTNASPLLRRGLFLFGIPFLMVLPWLFANLYVWHGLVPESGRAVRFLSKVYGGFPSGPVPLAYYGRNLLEMVNVLFRHFLTDGWFLGWIRRGLGLSKGVYYGGGFLLLSGLFIGLATRPRCGLGVAWREGVKRAERLYFLLLFSGLLAVAYAFYAFGSWFYGRYFFVVAFVVALYGGGLLDGVLTHVLRVYGRGWGDGVVKMLYGGIVLVSAVSTVGVLRGVREVPGPWCTKVIPWIERHLPEEATVASFQAGYLGYFLKGRSVVALDGVVNGVALAALEEGRMVPYIRSEGVDYVVDWRWMIEDLLFGRTEERWKRDLEPVYTMEGVHRSVDFLVYRMR